MKLLPGLLSLAVWPLLGQAGENIDAAAAVREGSEIYGKRCAACHGTNLRGGEGPNLFRSRILVAGSREALGNLIRNGVPGTSMIPFQIPDRGIQSLVAYLYSVTRPGQGPPVAGDPKAGEAVFRSSGCLDCHMISGKGGVLGPDLSGIALTEFPDRIRRSVVDPDAEIAGDFRAVTIVSRSQERIAGVLKQEDNFSLQVMKPDGQYAMLLRSEVADIRFSNRSLMPRPNLSAADLQNLLAFLDRQRARRLQFSLTFQNY